jgi:hypothetical protein
MQTEILADFIRCKCHLLGLQPAAPPVTDVQSDTAQLHFCFDGCIAVVEEWQIVFPAPSPAVVWHFQQVLSGFFEATAKTVQETAHRDIDGAFQLANAKKWKFQSASVAVRSVIRGKLRETCVDIEPPQIYTLSHGEDIFRGLPLESSRECFSEERTFAHRSANAAEALIEFCEIVKTSQQTEDLEILLAQFLTAE